MRSPPTKILVLDDSPAVRAAARYELEMAGYEVVETDNPIILTTLIRKEQPAILLVDIQMPALDGDKVVALMGREARARVKIILYSSLLEIELERLSRSCGADGYIRKSDTPGSLARQLARWL